MATPNSALKKYQKRGVIYFAICDSCFWCASYFSTNILDTNYYIPAKCPANIESIPIVQNEP
jgi:hypothetical protein